MEAFDRGRVLLDRWRAAWIALGAPAADDALFHELIERYTESHRRYHTVHHLEECFDAFEALRSRGQRPAEIELALWFHDAIHDPRRDDNEARSAEWAQASIVQAGIDEAVGGRVHALVMATRHRSPPDPGDAQIVTDVDLAILGAERPRFDEYECCVREEYAWVPESIFRRARRKMLEAFLARPRIYQTAPFFAALESRARENLEYSMAALEDRTRLKPQRSTAALEDRTQTKPQRSIALHDAMEPERSVASPSRDATENERKAMSEITPGASGVKALTFDVFGTVVDWHGSVAREVRELAKRKGLRVNAVKFTKAWRAGYRPAMDRVRSGELPYTKIDVLHRMILDDLLRQFKFADALTEEEKVHLNKVWHRLKPWPDAPKGLRRLKKNFIIATLSNGNTGLLVNMAKQGNLPWDCVFSSETFKHFKPDAQMYLGAADALDLEPSEVMMVASHKHDLRAAAQNGLKTAFIRRPHEYGRNNNPDLEPEAEFTINAEDFVDLAAKLGA